MAFPRPKFIIVAALTAFLAVFNNGYNAQVINVSETVFWQFINETNFKRHGVPMSVQDLNFLWGLIVSIVSLGGFIGTLIVPLFSERFGRKITSLIFANVLAIGSSILMSFCQQAESYEILACGRFLNGFSAGIATTLITVYLSECSPDEHRGLMGSCLAFSMNFISFLAYFLALPMALGSESNLPYLIGFGAIPAGIQMISAFFLPESPKFLYIKRGDVAEAKKSMRFWSATGEISETQVQKSFDDFDQEAKALSQEIGFLNAMKISHFRKVIILATMVFLGPSLVGAPAVLGYSTDMFLKLGFSIHASNTYTIVIAVVNTLGAMLVFPFVDRFPRRKFLFVGYGLVIFSISTYLAFAILYRATNEIWASYVAMISLQIYSFLLPVATGAVSWIIPTEIAPQAIRSVTASLSNASSWFFWLVVTLVYPPLENAMGPLCLLVFMVPWMIALVFLYRELPETGRKSVAEIVQEYSSNASNHK